MDVLVERFFYHHKSPRVALRINFLAIPSHFVKVCRRCSDPCRLIGYYHPPRRWGSYVIVNGFTPKVVIHIVTFVQFHYRRDDDRRNPAFPSQSQNLSNTILISTSGTNIATMPPSEISFRFQITPSTTLLLKRYLVKGPTLPAHAQGPNRSLV
ncbi:hypothetical protein M404DRAFT_556811 [Pisolithus tinctorius Marx 270]|uniref:Uncharacterized protein n=1 Tax=Pisolithus tinctorius Marx 270 TaxID=870435 RepID=A0A0C3K3U6_PISTI|nr:hypothetical protein M404DRAFT_556811 [Pisolithus tinctorius Marx 270]